METPQPQQANPESQIDVAQLERATNQMYGWEGSSDEQPEPEDSEEGQSSQAQPLAVGEAKEDVAIKETGKQDAGQSFDTIKPFLEDTPFKGDDIVKGVGDLAKSYKSLLSEYTPLSQKMKPYKAILDRMDADPTYKQNMLLADQMLSNPKMLEAYQAQQMGRPDPTQYDLYTPEGRSGYDQAEEAYIARQLDSRINQRFASLEQERMRERHISELKAAFPDANPEEVLRFAQEKSQSLGLADFHKLSQWDARESQLTEKIRKEMTSKLQQAQSSKTPDSEPPKESIQVNDVLKHVAKYNVGSAEKKYGKETVWKILQASTNAGWSPD